MFTQILIDSSVSKYIFIFNLYVQIYYLFLIFLSLSIIIKTFNKQIIIYKNVTYKTNIDLYIKIYTMNIYLYLSYVLHIILLFCKFFNFKDIIF